MSAAHKLTKNYFIAKFAAIISEKSGVQLGEKQWPMIESRLLRRMKQVNIENWEKYFDFFEQNRVTELEEVISLLTTHHTFFFREFIHFEALEKMLPSYIRAARARDDKTIRVWSAACSRGQEVYSLAMFFKYHLATMAPDVTFSIVGTDIDKQSVLISRNGVYAREEIKQVPLMYLSTHWSKGTGDIADFVRAKSSLKDHCQFEHGNLLEIPAFIMNTKFDVIFCRNVFIYFTLAQVKLVAEKMIRTLTPEGHLFVSVSESLKDMDLQIDSIGPAIYKLKSKEPVKVVEKPSATKPALSIVPTRAQAAVPPTAVAATTPAAIIAPPEPAKPLRVFCIDDSASILFLLKNILTTAEGFEIVGTASDGLDAAKKLPAAKADIVTLDIHMPNQNGLEYLKNNYKPDHPPVVMITAVSRDDSDLALTALQLGATDYVEKPTMNNFNDRADEIRTKLRVAHKAKKSTNGVPLNIDLDKSFKKPFSVSKPESMQRVVVASVSYRHSLLTMFKELNGNQPPTYLFIEGAESALPAFAKQLSADSGKNIKYEATLTGTEVPGSIILCDLRTSMPQLFQATKEKKSAILLFGDVSKNTSQLVLSWPKAFVLIEENTNKDTELSKKATDVVPLTSYAYLSNEFFMGNKT